MPERGTKCPKCGYVIRKYAISCPKCRTRLIKGESDSDLAARYLKMLQEEKNE